MSRYSRRKKCITRAANVAVFGACIGYSCAQAATFTWDAGGGATNSWGLNTNWSSDTVPSPGDDVVFASGGGSAVLNNVNRTIGAATFNATADFSLSSSLASLTINNGITAAAPTSAARTYTISASITLGADNIWNVDSTLGATTLSVSGIISNATAHSLTKTGSGALVLSGANTYTGSTILNAGTLQLSGGSNRLATTTAVTINSGTFELLNITQTIGSLAGAGGVMLLNGAGATLTINTTANTSFGGVITGSGALTKSGAGSETLSGSNTYTGMTTITAGTLLISGANDRLPTTGALSMTNGTFSLNSLNQTIGSLSGTNGTINLGAGILTVGDTTSTSFAGGITGAGSVVKQGSGQLGLSGGNSNFSGGLTIGGGTVQVGDVTGSNSDIGGPGSTITLNGGYLRWFGTGANATGSGRTILVGPLGGGIDASSAASGDVITIDGPVTGTGAGANHTLVLTGTNTGANTVSGIISDAGVGSATNVTKSGTGTWSLTGANTYTGTTTVSGGALVINSVANKGVASAIGAANDVEDGSAGAVLPHLILDGGTLRYTGTGHSTDRHFALGTGGGTIDASGTGPLSFNRWWVVRSAGADGARTLNLTGSNTGNNTLGLLIFDYDNGDPGGESGFGAATSLTKTGTGKWVLPATVAGQPSNGQVFNYYTGPTSILGGTLEVQANVNGVGSFTGGLFTPSGGLTGPSAVGASPLAASNLIIDGATLRYNYVGTAGTAAAHDIGQSERLFTLGAGGGTLENAGNGPLNFYNNGTMGLGGSGARTLTLSGTFFDGAEGTENYTALRAIITDGTGGATSVVKNGTGEWVLTGVNLYTGPTIVNAGTLLLAHGDSGGASTLFNVLPPATSLTVNSGGELELYTGDSVHVYEPLTQAVGAIAGTGIISLNGGTLVVNNTASNTFSGLIRDAFDDGNLVNQTGGRIRKQNIGTLIFTGNNTYTGTTMILGGTLQLGAGGTTGSVGTGDISNDANLVFNRSNTYTVPNAIFGSGSVYQIGTGTTVLTGASTYSGATTITAGTLEVNSVANGGSASALGAAGNLASNLVINGGALRYTGNGHSSDRLLTLGTTGILDASGAGSINLTNSGAIGFTSTVARVLTLTGSSTADNTLSALIGNNTGATSISKTGTGKWILSGPSSYTGVTTISGGVLQVSSMTDGGVAGPLGASSNAAANIVIDSGTLRYVGTGHSTDHLFTLTTSDGTLDASGSGAANFTNTGALGMLNTGDRTFNLLGTGIGTLAPIIPDVSGTGLTNLSKSGPGRWTLTGASTYAGTTTISDGTLQIGGGNDRLGTTTDMTISGGTFDLNNNNQTIASLAGSGSILLGSGSLTINSTSNTAFSGVIAGAGNLVKAVGNTQTLSGSNTYTGATLITGGTIALGASEVIGDSSPVTVNGPGAALNLGASHGETVFSLTLDGGGTLIGSGSSAITLNTGSYDLRGGTVSVPLNGSAGLNKSTFAPVLINSVNAYLGNTTVSGGVLQLGGNNRLPVATALTMAGGTFDLNDNNQTISSLTGSATVDLGSGVLTIDGSTSTTFTGVILGAGGVTKQGTSALTLTGANIYTGATTINAGSIIISGAVNRLPTASALTMGGGTLDLNSLNQTVASISGSSSILLGSALLTINPTSGSSVYSGIISGSGGVTKSGIGSQTFSGANNYGGTTTIGGGTLTLGASNALPNGGTVALTGGTLSLAGNSQTVGAISGTSNINLGGGAITINFSTGVYSGVISGTGGSVTKVSTGQLTLSGANTYTGGTNINDGTVQISGSADRLPTTGAVAMNGGTLDLNNLNQTVSGVSGSSSILLGSGVLTISPASGSSTYTGVMSGSGSVMKFGLGSQTLSGANSYTGTTTINGGSLLLGATNALPTSGTLAMTGGTLVLNGNNQTVGTLSGTSSINLGANTLTFSSSSGTYTGVISGAGGNIVKQSTGVATFGGGSTYTGVTTITGGGTLAVATLANGGANSGIGASTNANANLVLNNGVLRFVGASTNTSNRGYTLGAGGGGFDASGVGAATLTLGGSMSAPSGGSQTLSFFGSNTGNNTQSGQITDGTSGNVTSLTKDGVGKWLLADVNNTYTGVTTVTNGTLALLAASNNILNSPRIAVGSGAALDVTGLTAGLTLNTGQTLSGNGSVVGTVNLTNTSTIAPGASAGKLTFSGAGNISLSTSATVDMEIGAPTTPGTTYDQIVITNTAAKVLSLNGAKLKLTPNAGIVTGTAYTLITNSASSASISLASVFKNLDNTDLLETGGPYTQGPLSFTVDYDATFVKITFTTVPEPSSAVALALLGAPALMQRRRRRR